MLIIYFDNTLASKNMLSCAEQIQIEYWQTFLNTRHQNNTNEYAQAPYWALKQRKKKKPTQVYTPVEHTQSVHVYTKPMET